MTTVIDEVGFGRSDVIAQTYANGSTGDGAQPFDLGRAYGFIIVRIPDCSTIPSSTTINITRGETINDAMCDVYQQADAETSTQLALTPPATGSFAVQLNTGIMGARRIGLVLSAALTGDTRIEIYGVDPVVADTD